jgi:hypothetical protein
VATINLTDGFGLDVACTPSPLSLFAKYLKDPATLGAHLHDIVDLRDLTIGQDPFSSSSAGLEFTQPFTLGSNSTQWNVTPKLLGSLAIVTGKTLFGDATDPYLSPIPIPKGQAYLAAGIEASLALAAGVTSGDLQFGFKASTGVTLTNYRAFPVADKVVPAVKTTFENFVLPATLEDFQAIPVNGVVTVDGIGSLKFSVSANLLTAVNPLATVGTGALQGILQVKEAGGIQVSLACALSGAYQVRVQRTADQKFTLGFLRKRDISFSAGVSADIGLSANVESFDVLKSLLQAVSPDPVPDKKEFQKAGLDDAKLAVIAAAIKAGVERSVQLALKGELDLLDEDSTAFSYEMDTAALNDAGRAAIQKALAGDLSALEAGPLAGITPGKRILTVLHGTKGILKVNLLGVFNYASVTDCFLSGTIVVDPETGHITITDKVGASRVQFTSSNFAQDPARLRSVLAESLLTTVSYRASGTVPAAPEITSDFWLFDFHHSTSRDNIKDYLRTTVAMGLMSGPEMQSRLHSVDHVSAFGRSTFFADSSYGTDDFERLFLDAAGNPRPQEDYETIGRRALAELLRPGDSATPGRLLPLTNNSLWNKMKDAGQFNFAIVFEPYRLAPVIVGAISTDYTAIMWWAESMHNVAKALRDLLAYVHSHPNWNLQDRQFMSFRKKLDECLADVENKAKPQFSEPWGLLAMEMAAGSRDKKTARLSSPHISFSLP